MSDSYVDGLGEAMKKLQDAGPKLTNALTKAIYEGATMVENDAVMSLRSSEDESIKDLPPRNQTGRLKNSITKEAHFENKDSPYMLVGTNVEYAHGLEYGTSQTWPHPFMFPALWKNQSKIESMIKQAKEEMKNA